MNLVKQTWSDKQKAAHSTESFKAKVRQANKNYAESLSEIEKANINARRSDTMKHHVKNLTEDETIALFGKNIKIVPKLTVDKSVLNYIVINFNNFVTSIVLSSLLYYNDSGDNNLSNISLASSFNISFTL